MRITTFDLKKYNESLQRLRQRKAPNYVIEAYKEGHISVVNEYYRIKLENRVKGIRPNQTEGLVALEESLKFSEEFLEDNHFLKEATSVKDLDFIKAFFKMANLDLVSGDRLPPNASKLIRQKISKDFGLKDLFKKLR